MATVVTPTLYRQITLQPPNHMSFLHFLFCTKWSMQCDTPTYVCVYDSLQFQEMLAARPTYKREDKPLYVFRQ